jgi:hypothetical protein
MSLTPWNVYQVPPHMCHPVIALSRMIIYWVQKQAKCRPLSAPKIAPQIYWPALHEAFNDVFVTSYRRHHTGCTCRIKYGTTGTRCRVLCHHVCHPASMVRSYINRDLLSRTQGAYPDSSSTGSIHDLLESGCTGSEPATNQGSVTSSKSAPLESLR